MLQKTPPLFSIVVPVRNRRELLFRALLSVGHQTMFNFEVIVVDDGSSEDIAEVAGRFVEFPCRVVRQDPSKSGACAARNLGSRLARGTYIAYLDSDDVFLPRKMETLDSIVRADRPDLLASSLLVYRGTRRLQLRPSRGPRSDEDISEYYFVHDERIQSSSIIIDRRIFERVEWNENLQKVQDPDFFIRASRAATSLYFIDTPLSVLFDDQSHGRISGVSAEENLQGWLESEQCPLTPKARTGFIMYALSHEIAKRSTFQALRMTLRHSSVVHPRTLLKSIYRTFMPEWVFKWTARTLTPLSNVKKFATTYDFIKAIEAEASTKGS